MGKLSYKLILLLLACTWLTSQSGCAAPTNTPQTMDDWMALDQVNP